MRSCCKPALPFHRGLPPDALEAGDETDAQHQGVHGRNPDHQLLSIVRNEVERGADRQDCDGVDDGGHRRPGQPEPQRREDHDEQRKGRVVGHEHEALLEPALEDDPGRAQGYVHGAEEEQPAPGDGSARHEPVVHQAVERDQQHEQEGELEVVGKPESKAVGKLEQGDDRYEPAAPHRDPCGVPDRIRVEPIERPAARPKDAGCCPDWMKAPALARRLRHLLPRMRVRTWSAWWSRR